MRPREVARIENVKEATREGSSRRREMRKNQFFPASAIYRRIRGTKLKVKGKKTARKGTSLIGETPFLTWHLAEGHQIQNQS